MSNLTYFTRETFGEFLAPQGIPEYVIESVWKTRPGLNNMIDPDQALNVAKAAQQTLESGITHEELGKRIAESLANLVLSDLKRITKSKETNITSINEGQEN